MVEFYGDDDIEEELFLKDKGKILEIFKNEDLQIEVEELGGEKYPVIFQAEKLIFLPEGYCPKKNDKINIYYNESEGKFLIKKFGLEDLIYTKEANT